MKKHLILFVFAIFLLFITKVNAQQADSAAMQKTQQHIEGNLKDANKHQNKIDKSQKRIEKQQRRINRQERKRDKK